MPKSSGRPGGGSRLKTLPFEPFSGPSKLQRFGDGFQFGRADLRCLPGSVFALNCACEHLGRRLGLAASPGGTSTRMRFSEAPSTLLPLWFISNVVIPHGGCPAAWV